MRAPPLSMVAFISLVAYIYDGVKRRAIATFQSIWSDGNMYNVVAITDLCSSKVMH
jgi:hypothetical protein